MCRQGFASVDVIVVARSVLLLCAGMRDIYVAILPQRDTCHSRICRVVKVAAIPNANHHPTKGSCPLSCIFVSIAIVACRVGVACFVFFFLHWNKNPTTNTTALWTQTIFPFIYLYIHIYALHMFCLVRNIHEKWRCQDKIDVTMQSTRLDKRMNVVTKQHTQPIFQLFLYSETNGDQHYVCKETQSIHILYDTQRTRLFIHL